MTLLHYILKVFAIILQITFEKFHIVDSDLSRIYLRLGVKFGPAGLRGLRAIQTNRHIYTERQTDTYTYRQTNRQVFSYCKDMSL